MVSQPAFLSTGHYKHEWSKLWTCVEIIVILIKPLTPASYAHPPLMGVKVGLFVLEASASQRVERKANDSSLFWRRTAYDTKPH